MALGGKNLRGRRVASPSDIVAAARRAHVRGLTLAGEIGADAFGHGFELAVDPLRVGHALEHARANATDSFVTPDRILLAGRRTRDTSPPETRVRTSNGCGAWITQEKVGRGGDGGVRAARARVRGRRVREPRAGELVHGARDAEDARGRVGHREKRGAHRGDGFRRRRRNPRRRARKRRRLGRRKCGSRRSTARRRTRASARA